MSYPFELHGTMLIASSDGWNRDSHQMTKNQYGVFAITLPAVNGQPAIEHDSKVKVRILHFL